MRIRIWMLAAILSFSGIVNVQAAGDEKNGHAYFKRSELPDMAHILPAPPTFESARFVADESQYLWGKRQRLDSARCAQAKRDAVYSMATIIEEYREPFGLEITKEGTPEIYSVLQDVLASCDSIHALAKAHFNRQRPYAYYNEGTLIPEKEEKHRNEGSYPSGHTVFGWTAALLLSDINTSPQAMEALLARGYEFGQSRVIAGYHWQSDVDAGRLAGNVLYQMIRNNERFQGQLARARAEFTKKTKNYFTEWNDCEALNVLKGYVEDVTNPQSANFIKEEDRIATFDMDGTIIGELYPSYFEYGMLEYRVLDDPAYKGQAPADVRETAQQIRDFVRNGKPLPDHFDMRHGRAAAKAYAGMTLAEFKDYVLAFAAKPVNGFSGMTYGESFYKPMLQVFDYLNDHGFTIYVVSGTDRYLCRALVEPFGISPDRVIGMDVQLCSTKQGSEPGVDYTMGKEESIIRTDSLLVKNLKTNKVVSINKEIGKVPVISFGNSSGDCSMHNYCMSNPNYRTATFMLVADDAARDYADLEEGAKREAKWRQNGYTVISMKNDFKTIYGEGVKKTKFHFFSSIGVP